MTAALALLLVLPLQAGPAGPDPVVRLGPEGDRYVVDAFAVLKDADHTLTFDDVRARDAAFVPYDGYAPNYGYTDAAYWVRFDLLVLPPARDWLFEVSNPNISYIALYVPDATGAYRVQTAGTHYPFAQRPIRHRQFLFPLDLPTGRPVRCYLKLSSSEPLRFVLRVWTPTAFFTRDHDVQLLFGAYYGLLVILLVYHVVLFFTTRDPTYVPFVLGVTSLGLLQFVMDGFAFAYLWPSAPDWNQECRGLLNGLSCYWLFVLARMLLDTRNRIPRIDFVLRALGILCVQLVILKLLVYVEDWSFWDDPLDYLMVGLLLVGAAGAFVRRRSLPARLRYRPSLHLVLPVAYWALVLLLDTVEPPHVGTFDRVVNTIVSLGGAVTILTAAVLAWARGVRTAPFFALAFGGFLAGAMLEVLMHIGLLPLTPVTLFGEKAGLAAGLVLLSLSLADRIRGLQRRATEAEALVLHERRSAAEARLDALQAQINPHFLYNVLNSIASLVPVAPARAVRAVEMLARLFRYTLRRPGGPLVSLPEELAVVRAYLDLEKLRLEERLTCTIDAGPGTDRVLLPALLVQPLVENSIKHAVAPRRTGGCVEVRAVLQENVCTITVTDDGPGWPAGTPRDGHGLRSVEERLALAFGPRGRLTIRRSGRGTTVELTLPVSPASVAHDAGVAVPRVTAG